MYFLDKKDEQNCKILMLRVGSKYAIYIVTIWRSAAAVGPWAIGSSFCTGLVAIVTVGLFWGNDTVCLALTLRTKTLVNLGGKVQLLKGIVTIFMRKSYICKQNNRLAVYREFFAPKLNIILFTISMIMCFLLWNSNYLPVSKISKVKTYCDENLQYLS